jgi:formylglycine-generating enzyme required for sulfatase activity
MKPGWKQNGKKRWLWVGATATLVARLLGEKLAGILCSDRWTAYGEWPMNRRQLCWAHLKRNAGPSARPRPKKARAAWAKYLKIEETRSIDLGNGVKLDLVLIPPGKYKMGSPKSDKDAGENEVQHDVEITKPFYLAATETTQEQYKAVMGENPSRFQNGKNDAPANTTKFPVEEVSWKDAVKFCEKSGVKGMRLPTEGEWEYACRAGTETKYHFGDELGKEKANFDSQRTVDVRSYASNGFGLYDMHGNVREWCKDDCCVN